jgi:hypothetical protein
MTVTGTKKKSYDVPIRILEVINLAILNESTPKVIFNEREMLLKMIQESPTFRRYARQLEKTKK